MPFPRSATQYWSIEVTPSGPTGKRSSALLRSLELAMTSPAVTRLAANRFPIGCILIYYLEGVLGRDLADLLLDRDDLAFQAIAVTFPYIELDGGVDATAPLLIQGIVRAFD